MSISKPSNLLNKHFLKQAALNCSQNMCKDMLDAVNNAKNNNDLDGLINACADPAFSMEYNLKLKPDHGKIPLCDNDTKQIPAVKSILNKVKAQVAEPKYAYSTNISDDKYVKITDSKDSNSTAPIIADSKSTAPIIADSKSTAPIIADSKSTAPIIADSKSTAPIIADSKSLVNPNISADAKAKADAKRIAENVRVFKNIAKLYTNTDQQLLVCVLYFMNECFYQKEINIIREPYSTVNMFSIKTFNANSSEISIAEYFKLYVTFYDKVNEFGYFNYDYPKLKPIIDELYPGKLTTITNSIKSKYFLELDNPKKDLVLNNQQVLNEIFELMEFKNIWNNINKHVFMSHIYKFYYSDFNIGNHKTTSILTFIKNNPDTFDRYTFKGGKRKSKRNKNIKKNYKTRRNRKYKK